LFVSSQTTFVSRLMPFVYEDKERKWYSEPWKNYFFCTIHFLLYICSPKTKGSLAQLVQSICLTSRGSGVRTPQLPHKASNLYSRLLFCICFRIIVVFLVQTGFVFYSRLFLITNSTFLFNPSNLVRLTGDFLKSFTNTSSVMSSQS